MTLAVEKEAKGGPGVAELEPNEFRIADVRPGKAIRLGDIAVFNVDGSFYATQAQCTHMGGPLCEGKLEGTTLTCPWHGARFNVSTGQVLRGPAMKPLELYQICVEGAIGRIELDLEE